MGYNPSYKWINPIYPIYNWGYNPLTKWVVRHQVIIMYFFITPYYPPDRSDHPDPDLCMGQCFINDGWTSAMLHQLGAII